MTWTHQNSTATPAKCATSWREPMKAVWTGLNASSPIGKDGRAVRSKRISGGKGKQAMLARKATGEPSKGVLEHQGLKAQALRSTTHATVWADERKLRGVTK